MSVIPVARVNNQPFRREQGRGLYQVGGAVLGALLAFPFGQGYKVGSTLTGGRSLGAGEVRKVTNRNNSGAGSLRAAVETAGPADVVFEISGAIAVDTELLVKSDLTIWGETAPSPGITVIPSGEMSGGNSGGVIDIVGNNIVLRHLRVRLRHDHAAQITTLNIGQSDPFQSLRTISANCSFSCGVNETTFIARTSFDHTFYRCIIGNSSYSGKAALLSSSDTDASQIVAAFIQCLFPRSFDRMPYCKAGTQLAYYNNLLYASGHPVGTGATCGNAFNAQMAKPGTIPLTTTRASVRGNLYVGNAANRCVQFEFDDSLGDATPHHQSYFSDNDTLVRCVESGAVVVDAVANESDLGFTLPEVATVLSSAGIKAHVLARVGARPLDRDSQDVTIIDDATNLTGGAPSTSAPPSYALGTGSATFTTPANWNTQASGEASGWRVLDKYIYQTYTLAVETV